MTDRQILAIANTEKIIESINILLDEYKEWGDMGENTEGGRRYNCLLETKLLAEEYQAREIIKVMKD